MQNDTTTPVTMDITGGTAELLGNQEEVRLEIDSSEARDLLAPSLGESAEYTPTQGVYKIIRTERYGEVTSSCPEQA